MSADQAKDEGKTSAFGITPPELPKLKIDLGAFGIPAVSIEIPMPTFNFKRKEEKYAVPHSKWKARIRGWYDGFFYVPTVSDQLNEYEQEISIKLGIKRDKIDSETSQYKLDIQNALRQALLIKFDSSAAILSIKNRIQNWVQNVNELLHQCKITEQQCEDEVKKTNTALEEYTRTNNLKHKRPKTEKPLFDKIIGVAFFAILEISLSSIIIASGESFSIIMAFVLACVLTVINVGTGIFSGSYLLYEAERANSFGMVFRYAFFGILVITNLAIIFIYAFGRDQISAGGSEFKADKLSILFRASNYTNASFISLSFLLIGLLIFYISINKGYHEFSSPDEEHKERWDDYQKAERNLRLWRDYRRVLTMHVQNIGFAITDNVRSSIDDYLAKILIAKKDTENLLSKLIAKSNYWARIVKIVNESAESAIKTYSTSKYRTSSKANKVAIGKGKFPHVVENIDLQSERAIVVQILNSLKESELEVGKFNKQFEEQLVPYVKGEMHKLSSTITSSTK